MSVYRYKVKDIKGGLRSLDEFKGKVLLIVNTASKCGFTPQYEGLELLFKKYKEMGFEVLAFPCNQFGAQEPGNESEIESFCDLNFKISFPLFSKIEVNGDDADKLFEYLKEESPGILGTKMIKWNFTKFLIDKNGKPVNRFSPKTEPRELESEIEKLL